MAGFRPFGQGSGLALPTSLSRFSMAAFFFPPQRVNTVDL